MLREGDILSCVPDIGVGWRGTIFRNPSVIYNLKRYNNGSNLPEERELVIWGRTTLHVVASGTQPFKEENHKS